MIDLILPRGSDRLNAALDFALQGIEYRHASLEDNLQNRRLLFALCTDDCGMDEESLRLLRQLRRGSNCLQGSVGAMVVDGESELYTKQLAQEMTLAANLAGCAFPGKPLVEATGTLYNQHILAAQRNLSWKETYFQRVRELVMRLETFMPPKFSRPKLLMLHASEQGRSSTLWLWQQLRLRLEPYCDIQEVSLQNGTVHDCRGCTYSACLHYAKNGTCFYGGAISETVLPAIRQSNALMLLCPNYNDAVGANITALFNRLTSLLLHSHLYDKYLFGLVVSGYSGSDLVAKQLLGAMCLNKTAMLPPYFCHMETANDLEAVQKIPEISEKIDVFAQKILKTLVK